MPLDRSSEEFAFLEGLALAITDVPVSELRANADRSGAIRQNLALSAFGGRLGCK
ncbi:hypothetical protein SH661x_003801 [Planctomicrobium sp. SH661]|uniref:hypothetical protein n=1 Tax=Planctomicrobium sp. SH661 TaxID=3448124 RepID=UPI003F5B0903